MVADVFRRLVDNDYNDEEVYEIDSNVDFELWPPKFEAFTFGRFTSTVRSSSILTFSFTFPPQAVDYGFRNMNDIIKLRACQSISAAGCGDGA